MNYVQECQTNNISTLYSIQNDSENSFSLLHSVLGYTQTEWMIEKKSVTASKEFIILDEKSPHAFVRIKPKDSTSQSVEIQVHCLRTCHQFNISSPLKTILTQIINYENTTRFYCFLFPFEKKEQSLLKNLGFSQEAIYDQHIYSKGKYLDLLVFGTERIQTL